MRLKYFYVEIKALFLSNQQTDGMVKRQKNGRFVSDLKKKVLQKISETNSRSLPTQSLPPQSVPPLPGRRIVDVDFLSSKMQCKMCNEELSLKSIISEKREGLGSYFYIKCICGLTNKISTGKTHKKFPSGKAIFDINTKAAAAMVHVGLGPSHMCEVFSVMNIPPPTEKTLKIREREVGPKIESEAKKTCEAARSNIVGEENNVILLV